MSIQFYPDELDYVNAKLSIADENSFLASFCRACLRADDFNYELLRLNLEIFRQKYPADPFRLAMERHDRGASTPEDEKLIRDRALK